MWVIRKCHICAPSRTKAVACGCSVHHTCHTKEPPSQQPEDDETVRDESANSPRDNEIGHTARIVSTELIDASGNSDEITKPANEKIQSVESAAGESYESLTLLPDSVSDWESQLREIIGESTLEPTEGIESHRGGASLKRPASPPEMDRELHYMCDVCGKEYPTRPKLTWHRKIHGMTGEVVEWSAWR